LTTTKFKRRKISKMPAEFHLSIKNTQRKIADVRDLFRNLSETEKRVLEIAKRRAEEEKRQQIEQETNKYNEQQRELNFNEVCLN
jgi:hypothetical protein